MQKTAVFVLFLALSSPAIAQPGPDYSILTRPPGQPGQVYRSVELPAAARATTTCFIKGERESGQNKMCFYDCVGSDFAQNIPAYGVCAPQIQK